MTQPLMPQKYSTGVQRRLGRLLWLYLFVLGLLLLNAHLVMHVMSQTYGVGGGEVALFSWANRGQLLNIFWAATLCYLLPLSIPHHTVRIVVISLMLTLLIGMYLVDVYLLDTFGIPYCDGIAAPIIATNPEETQGFFKSLTMDWLFLLREVGKILALLALSLSTRLIPRRKKKS